MLKKYINKTQNESKGFSPLASYCISAVHFHIQHDYYL